MNLWTGVAVAAALLAAADAAAPPVPLSVWAVHATREGREAPFFDPGLEPIAEALRALPFDTFRRVMAGTLEIPLEEERRIEIDARYALFATPLARDEKRRTRLNLRVERAADEPGGKPVKAMETQVSLAPGHPLKFGGFPRDGGDLVVVLRVD